MDYEWDIFIGYASIEHHLAKQLFDLLKTRCRVFLDTECLLPGDRWMHRLPAAQRSSRITVLLVSAKSTPQAWYQNAEIVAAIGLARAEDAEHRRVIPVYLDGTPPPSDKPYGLEPLVDIDAPKAGGMQGVAKEIASLLDRLGVPHPSETPAAVGGQGSPIGFFQLRDELADLLKQLFTIAAMKDFLSQEPNSEQLQTVLSSKAASKSALALSAVEALIRGDHLRPELFRRLAERKPHGKDEIQRVEAQVFPQAKRSQQQNSMPPRPEAPGATADEPSDARLSANASMRVALGAALQLDRSQQWTEMTDQCRTDESLMFLLHGDSRQSLVLFLDRVQYYLVEESAHKPHLAYRVPLEIQGSSALSGDEWLTHMSHALATLEEGTLDDLLTKLTNQQALLLILGQSPLYNLTTEQKAGLRDLLVRSWPELLRRIAPRNPVRLLLPVDYDGDGDPVVDELDAWALQGEALGSFKYIKLMQVIFPSWDEVRSYLDNKRPRPAAGIVERIREEYDYLAKSKLGDFKQLSERLDRHLGDLPR